MRSQVASKSFVIIIFIIIAAIFSALRRYFTATSFVIVLFLFLFFLVVVVSVALMLHRRQVFVEFFKARRATIKARTSRQIAYRPASPAHSHPTSLRGGWHAPLSGNDEIATDANSLQSDWAFYCEKRSVGK